MHSSFRTRMQDPICGRRVRRRPHTPQDINELMHTTGGMALDPPSNHRAAHQEHEASLSRVPDGEWRPYLLFLWNWYTDSYQTRSWWHWWLSRRRRRAGKFSWAPRQSLHSLRHGDQCWEDQADDKHQWHQHRDRSEWTEAWDSHKLQIPGLSYNWWGFQAWVTLQDNISNSSIDKAKTNLDWQEYFSQLQDATDALPCHIHLPVWLWIMDPHSRAPKKNTSHGNEMLLQDSMHLIQRLCYQRGSSCQDPAGNRTAWRPLDHCKEMQTAVVWTCLPFLRSGQNHLARHSERGKKTRQTEEEVERHFQGMDRPGVRQVPEGSGEQGKMEETGCKIICGASTTLMLKG